MELNFRKIVSEDKDEIINLFIETFKKEPWNEDWNYEVAQEKINWLMNNSLSENYCVTNEHKKIIGVLLGYGNYHINRKELYIEDFFIDYNCQKKGIGKKLMEYVETEMKQKNYSSIILLTKRTFPSEYFYTNLNFKILSNMILMHKDIRE